MAPLVLGRSNQTRSSDEDEGVTLFNGGRSKDTAPAHRNKPTHFGEKLRFGEKNEFGETDDLFSQLSNPRFLGSAVGCIVCSSVLLLFLLSSGGGGSKPGDAPSSYQPDKAVESEPEQKFLASPIEPAKKSFAAPATEKPASMDADGFTTGQNVYQGNHDSD